MILVLAMLLSSVPVYADGESTPAEDQNVITADPAADEELNDDQAASPGPSREESGEALSENDDPESFYDTDDSEDESGSSAQEDIADPSLKEEDGSEDVLSEDSLEPDDGGEEQDNTEPETGDPETDDSSGEIADQDHEETGQEDRSGDNDDPGQNDSEENVGSDEMTSDEEEDKENTEDTSEKEERKSDNEDLTPGDEPDEAEDASEEKDFEDDASEKASESDDTDKDDPEKQDDSGSRDAGKKTEEEESAKDASASAADLSLGSMTRYGSFYFTVGKMSASGGVKKARIAVWCSADKSDKKWYNVDINTGKALCNVSNHKYHFGKYTAKLFVTDASGNEFYAGYCKKTYSYKAPSCDSVTIAMNSRSSMKFTVTVKNLVSYCGISDFQAAVWSADDQSDLCWYASSRNQGSGTWTFTGSLSEHKYRQAIYTAHIYLTDKTGNALCIGGGTKKIKIIPGDISAVYHKDTLKTDLSLPSIRHYSLLDHVEYSVWKDDGDTSDLKTYSVKLGDGHFEKTVSMTKFSGNGTYRVSCYGVSITGKRTYYGETSFKATEIPLKVTYEFNRISRAKVSITVYNANVNGVLADYVEMATWSDAVSAVTGSNQDDLVWYEGVKNADGSFTCIINRSSHISSGMFHTHIYAYTGTKSAFCLGLNYKLYKTKNFAGKYLEFARKAILAVESGGQIYGNARYDAFAPAYSISSAETGITIGAGQWMGSRAVKLLIQIRNADPGLFAATAPIINADLTKLEALPESKWAYYGSTVVAKDMTATSKRAKQIKAVISTETGIAVQNSLINADLSASAEQIKNAGVTDTDAIVFMVNVAHLGGVSAAYRIIKAAKADGLDLIVEDLWTTMQKDVDDTTSSVQVGDSIFHSRHLKIIGWIYDYLN